MKHLIISAGHNPQKTGASWKDLKEHDICVHTVKEVVQKLAPHIQVSVISTGGLKAKVQEVNRIAAAGDCIAVEVHYNAAGTTYVEGNETLYYPGSVKGKKLATEFNEVFMKHAGHLVMKDRGVKEGWYRMDSPGVIDYAGDVDGDETPDYWLRKTSCPSLILEPCFMCQVEKIGYRFGDVTTAIAMGLTRICAI